jgi:hypothetical protein
MPVLQKIRTNGAANMKSRPILFSAPMVRALLDGSKTQTRRVAKLTDAAHIKEIGGHRRWHPADPDVVAASPYGQVGDQLWVREAFRTTKKNDSIKPSCLPVASSQNTLAIPFWYDADIAGKSDHLIPENLRAGKYRPGIFMPRAASRITLEVTSVRVERLQDISEADALAEGIIQLPDGGYSVADTRHYSDSPDESYASLWESLNGAGSWDLNPWVWVIEFKKVKP